MLPVCSLVKHSRVNCSWYRVRAEVKEGMKGPLLTGASHCESEGKELLLSENAAAIPGVSQVCVQVPSAVVKMQLLPFILVTQH